MVRRTILFWQPPGLAPGKSKGASKIGDCVRP